MLGGLQADMSSRDRAVVVVGSYSSHNDNHNHSASDGNLTEAVMMLVVIIES